MRILLSLVLLLLGGSGSAPVRLLPPPGGTTSALPCRFGLLLPRGRFRPESGLFGRVGRSVCSQLDLAPVLFWPDGSLRWVRVTGLVDLPRGGARWFEAGSGKAPAGRVQSGAEGLESECRPGLLRIAAPVGCGRETLDLICNDLGPGVPATVGPGSPGWFRDGGGPHAVWRGASGEVEAAQLESATLLRADRATAEVAFLAGMGGSTRVRGRLVIRAGTPILEWEACVEGWPDDAAAGGVGMHLAGPLSAVVFRHRRSGRLRAKKARTVRFVVEPDRDPCLVVDGEPLTEGSVEMLVALGHDGRWLTIGASPLATRSGYVVEAEEDRVRLWLRKAGGGQPQRRERFQLTFALTTSRPKLGMWRAVQAAANFGGAIAWTAGASLDRCGGLGRWPHAGPAPGVTGKVYRRTLALFQEEMERPDYRSRDDFGDYRVPALGFANHEYDAILALVRAFVWTRESGALAWARCAVRHHLDVDADWRGGGLPRMHGPDHDGGVEPGHTWVHGLFAYGLLCGDPEVVAAAERTAEAVCEFTAASRNGFRHERDYAWSLRALTCAAELTGRADLAAGRDRLAADLLRHVHPGGMVMVEPTRRPTSARTTTFTALGVVAPALAGYGRSAGDSRALVLARRIARRYLAEAWDPERETLAWTLHVDLATGRVTGVRGVVSGADLLFVAAGLAEVGDDECGGWCRRQAERLELLGVARFRRDGHGRDNGERVRVLNALFELAARRR